MGINTANAVRLAVNILAGVVIALGAAWGVLALWYQAPGGHAGKIVIVLLWAIFSVYGPGAKQELNAHDRFNLVKMTLSSVGK